MRKRKTAVGLILGVLAFFSAAALLRLAFVGGFQLILPVHSPLNAESILALCFVLAVLIKARRFPEERRAKQQGSDRLFFIGLVALTLTASGWALGIPLLHDSYGLIGGASRQSFSDVLKTFYEHPVTGDFFFRPITYLSYWIDYQWAHFEPIRWNVLGLSMHMLNVLSTYILATQLGFRKASAFLAASVFAVHGSRPEVTVWVAARVDLLAVFLILQCLLLFNKFLRTGNRASLALSMLFGVLACFTKESAFCVPGLLLCLLFFHRRENWGRVVRGSAIAAVLIAGVFSYRYWVLGGIGGYRGVNGTFNVVHFDPIHFVKGLFYREWALLFFPINWSTSDAFLVTGLVLQLVALVLLVCWFSADKKMLAGSLIFVVVASLPAQHLLLIGSDSAGSRYLYLPGLGFALFLGSLLNRAENVRRVLLAGFVSVASQMAMTWHNLSLWQETAVLSQQICHSFGSEIAGDSRRAAVVGLPATRNGVYFLKNGFSDCVAVNAGVPASKVYPVDSERELPTGYKVYMWNTRLERIQEVK